MGFFAEKLNLSRGAGLHNIRAIEGLRGLAVSFVFLVHYTTLVRPRIAGSLLLAFSNELHTIGNTGVDLFFVLSGYLIYGSLIIRPQSFGRFMARRATRIYPAFMVVFVIYIVMSSIFPAENKIPAPLPAGLVYLAQNILLLPGLFPVNPMITVAWSLSYEMLYYFAIPLLIVVFRLRDRDFVWRVSFFLTLTAAIIMFCTLIGEHVRLIMFISGILVHEALANKRAYYPNSFVGLLALAIGLIAISVRTTVAGANGLKFGILFISFFTFCLACFADSSASLPRALSWTPLRWLGNMSYSYYLLHGLALKAAFIALAVVLPADPHGSYWIFWALMPTMFAITLIPTAALFLTIERPFSLAPHREARRFSESRSENTGTKTVEAGIQ